MEKDTYHLALFFISLFSLFYFPFAFFFTWYQETKEWMFGKVCLFTHTLTFILSFFLFNHPQYFVNFMSSFKSWNLVSLRKVFCLLVCFFFNPNLDIFFPSFFFVFEFILSHPPPLLDLLLIKLQAMYLQRDGKNL